MGRRPAPRSRWVIAEQYAPASRKVTFSTGRLESPGKWLGFGPSTAVNSPWVTSYFPIQKSRVIVTGNLIRMKVPALMSTILVKGTREAGIAGRDEADCPFGSSELPRLQPSSEESARNGMKTPQNRGISRSSCEGSPPMALCFLVTVLEHDLHL